MGKYLLKRFIYLIAVFFFISLVLFFIFKATPGDPALMMIEGGRQSMTPEAFARAHEQARALLGLDDNYFIQYFRYLFNMLTGNFGYSTAYQRPVMQVAMPALKLTVQMNLIIMFFVFAISIPLGIATAVKKGKAQDQITQVITILGHSLPSFIFAILLIFTFAVRLQLFPISGVRTPNIEGNTFELLIDRIRHMVLPVLTMTFIYIAGITRYVRASMIEALRMDYIRTARAKGLREKVVVYSHAFRNSLIPLVTALVAWFIGIFSGAMIVESIFLYNGMGQLMLSSLRAADWSVVLAFNTFYMLLALVGNLVMDLLYLVVDPRVKLS